MDWNTEEKQRFIKKKAVYQKAGLSNVFKNRSKTKGDIKSKCEYLKEVVEWTLGKVQKRQAKSELQEMEEWLNDFQQKINTSYSTTKEKMEGPEYIWKFDQDAYEKELMTAWREEEEEKSKGSEATVTPRRSRRAKSITSNKSGAKNENEAVENQGSKVDEQQKGESSEEDEDGNDYAWSDVASIASNSEFNDFPSREKRSELQAGERNKADDGVRDWLEEKSDMNETVTEVKKEMEGHWTTIQKSIEKLSQRVVAVETKREQVDIKGMVKEELESTKRDLVKEVKISIGREMEDVFKRMEKRWETKIETRKEPPKSSLDIASSIEKHHFQEAKLEKALKGIPKFDGTEIKFHTWRKRITDVIEKFEFLEKESYEKYQMMVDRMTEEAADTVRDIEELEEKPYETALDRLDRRFLFRSQEERIMAKLKEIAKIDNGEKEKWKKVKQYLESLETGYSESTINWAITFVIIMMFDRKLEERWKIEQTRRKGSDKVEIMKQFLEQIYEKILDSQPEEKEEKGEGERKFKCYLCDEKHGLKCDMFAALTRQERIDLVKEKALCFNCLKPGHIADDCRRPICKCGEKKHFRIHSCKKYYVMSLELRSNRTLTYIKINNKKALVMPDLGADISIISSEAAKRLKAKRIGKTQLEVRMVTKEHKQLSNVYELEIQGFIVKCYELNKMPKREQKELGDAIPEVKNQQLDLIIGNNAYPLIRHNREHQVQGGVVVETPIGSIFYEVDTRPIKNVNMLLKNYVVKEKKISVEEEMMVEKLEKDLEINAETIIAPLMLKAEVTSTLCSFGQARKRLLSQLKKMESNKEFEQRYDEAVYAYLDESFAIEKPADTLVKNFIPHHLVLNPNKKPRLVFACNTKGKNGKALNDVLGTGVVQLNEIPRLLNKWRERKYFGLADIRAMYHQIMMLKKQYGLCAFLYWKKDVQKTEGNITIFVMTRHVFGARDSPCVALKALEKMLEGMQLEASGKQELKESFYMDDLLITSDNRDRVEGLLDKAKEGLKPQFNLTKIYSNIPEIREKYAVETIECKRVLGISYDQVTDEISFNTDKFKIGEKEMTYQGMASALMRVYDPQGVIEPIRAVFKSLYSKLIISKHQWKDKMPEQAVKEWNLIAEKYKLTKRLPRYVGKVEEYVMFADASKQRYGAVIYGVIENEYKVLCAKSRVISHKDQQKKESIPNNELNAALLGAELVQEYCFEKSEKKVRYYSDNKAVIQFIRDQSIPVDSYKRRRIKRIIEISDREEWRYIESAENPADMLTKEPLVEKLDSWFSRRREPVDVMMTMLPWRQESEELSRETLLERIKEEQSQLDIRNIERKLHIEKGEEGVWQVVLRKTAGAQHKKILLSNKLPIAERIARQMHNKLHIGRDALRTEMRKDFYTIGETELAKRIYNSCKRCQEQVQTPKFAYEPNDPHPDQLARKVFKNIGLDHTAVLVKDEKVRRNLWRKAKIEELIPSHDGKIRNVEIREQNGKTGKRSLKDLVLIN